MTTNVGSADRAVRWIVGVALVLLGVFNVLSGTAAIIAYVVAAIALITGTVGYCLLWRVCKINTAKKTSEKSRLI